MFPLLNFATYSQNYSYYELFYLSDNSFTSLDISDYYKWWNVKALINFKWNTYGKRYYFLIWSLYSIFMCCFLIVSTISKNEISWNNQVVLLIVTIFLGFIHFIFEVRQLVHRPMHYITSPWNWFDLAAILFPTITSIIWLHDITLPAWIITISVFLLEIRFLLFFRILVLAFAHSLHILLRPTTEYSYNQPSYTDDSNNPWNLVSTYQFISSNGTVEGSSLVEIPDDNTNMFALFSTSLLAILSEIELFWMLPYQRKKKNWFPDILYYEATLPELKKYIKKSIEDEEIFENLFPSVKKRLQNLFPKIKELTEIEDSNKEITEIKESNKEITEIEDPNKEIKDTIKDELKDLKAQMDESLKDIKDLNAQMDESLKNLKAQINESSKDSLKTQINEALKNPIDKFNKLIEFIEKKESE
ncbi:nudt9 protein [Gigaspora margarita]|uniref:Nudt9 protein n=1 Tax=Gigaspora margarita TaxID=4874 RepID=A0A8H4AA75_GIGMA|nr:nudt9 protein [Gigaspora margarita]